MIPFAEIMDEEDAVRVLSSWALTDGDRILREAMPQISIDDPVVLALQDEMGVSAPEMVGRIVAFTRRSPTAGITKYYRVIVPSGLFQISSRQDPSGVPTWGPMHRRYAACFGDVR